jgi:uncharacterized SAM-binding protein YcdF (DUF218 family)
MKKKLLVILLIICVFFGAIFGLGKWLNDDQMASCEIIPTSEKLCEKADAIVAISGGDTEIRAMKAIEMWKENFAKTIIFSGAAADPNSQSDAEKMMKIAVKNGVPKSAILLDKTSRNTTENAKNVAKILAKNNWKNIILITQNYHLRRAEINFQEQNPNVRIRMMSAENDTFWWVKPSGIISIFRETGGVILLTIGVGK